MLHWEKCYRGRNVTGRNVTGRIVTGRIVLGRNVIHPEPPAVWTLWDFLGPLYKASNPHKNQTKIPYPYPLKNEKVISNQI